MKANFKNDYSTLCHPRILEALKKYTNEVNEVYGLDRHSKRAAKYIKEIFGVTKGEVFFINGGTMTNLLFISYVLRPHEAVVAVKTAHINVHETGAIEGTGHKILLSEGKNGKLYPSDIKEIISSHTDEHMVKPKLVYISNSTEIGTYYTKKELSDLFKTCKENNLYLFVDGARLGAALTASGNDLLPLNMGELCDAFYVGGAKNGLLGGEALVINHKDLAKDFRFHMKNRGALTSKGFALGIQFAEIFKDTLYFDLAKRANEMARDLFESLKQFNLEVLPVETNQLFVKVKNEHVERLVKDFGLEVWKKGEETTLVRFVTSFTTTKKDIEEAVKTFKEIL